VVVVEGHPPLKIHVDLEDGTGVLTKGYQANNQTAAGQVPDPSTDSLRANSGYDCVSATIYKAEQTIEAEDVETIVGDSGKAIVATVTGVFGETEGVGALSFEVTEGADVVSVDAETGALTLLKPGTATVRVTAAEADNYARAIKDVKVTVLEKQPTDPTDPTDPKDPTDPTEPLATVSISFKANGGTGEMPALTVAAGSSTKLPANEFNREGYEFARWNTKADGTGDSGQGTSEIPERVISGVFVWDATSEVVSQTLAPG